MKAIKVYQTENNYYKDMKLFGKLKYVGKSFGAVSLTNNRIYNLFTKILQFLIVFPHSF